VCWTRRTSRRWTGSSRATARPSSSASGFGFGFGFGLLEVQQGYVDGVGDGFRAGVVEVEAVAAVELLADPGGLAGVRDGCGDVDDRVEGVLVAEEPGVDPAAYGLAPLGVVAGVDGAGVGADRAADDGEAGGVEAAGQCGEAGADGDGDRLGAREAQGALVGSIPLPVVRTARRAPAISRGSLP
jgi:hypothetical protein